LCGLAGAAADRGATERDTAHATGFHASLHAVTAGLEHVAALLVAAGAGDAAAVFGHFALAIAAAQIALAHDHAVHHAAAAAHAACQHLAEILQSAASYIVFAGADHLHAAGALFHLDRAARQHDHVAAHGGHLSWHAGGGHAGHTRRTFHHHHRA